MNAIYTDHAQKRSQQRGIPPLIRDWLLFYGDERYDHHGGIVRYFSKTSLRKLERDIGREPLRRLSEYLQCYLVEDSSGGQVITVGKRHASARIRRQ